jgi:AcrR family transcriptional regulator
MMRERPQLDRRVLHAYRRRHLTDALGELCIEQGFRATTISDVVDRAETSRATVYELFANKEEIFLALLERTEAELFARVEEACRSTGEGPERQLEAGLAAVLRWVAGEPIYAWICFVESVCATPDSLRRYLEAIAHFTELLRDVLPPEVPRPKSTEESLVGGVASILSGTIRAGEAERAPALHDQLLVFLRGPFLSVSARPTAAI